MKGDSFAMGNPAPTALDSGIGLWFAYNSGNTTFRVGNPVGNVVRWDGSELLVRTGDLTIDNRGLTILNSVTSGGYTGARGVKWDVPGPCDPYLYAYGSRFDLAWVNAAGCPSSVNLSTVAGGVQQGAMPTLNADVAADSFISLEAPRILLRGANARPSSPRRRPDMSARSCEVNNAGAGGTLGQLHKIDGYLGAFQLGGCSWAFWGGVLVAFTCP